MTKFDPLRPVPCVYYKHGRYWLVKRNKWIAIGKTLDEALAEYARIGASSKTGGMGLLVDDALPGILRGKADSTTEQYKLAAATLKRKLAKFDPEQVTTKTVYAIQSSLADTPNMANRVITVLRMVFDYGVKHRQGITANPCTGVKRLTERKRERLLTDDEWHAIHGAAGARLQIIMELQHLTGQRISDVLSIRRSQIKDDGIAFTQAKTGAKLLVRWTPELRAAVASANALSADRPALTLLRGKYGGPPDYRSVVKQWQDACAAAAVEDAKLNDGRALSATSTKRQGKSAQALLGHTSPAMTERYLRDRDTPQVEGPILPKKSFK